MDPKGPTLGALGSQCDQLARVIYVEHDKQELDWGRYSPPGSLPVSQRVPRSWPRIRRKYSPDVVSYLTRLRPGALASQMLDLVPIDPGVERLAIARSREPHPPGPRIEYLETTAQSYAPADSVSSAVWDDAVSWALDNPGSSKTLLETSYRAWIAGDYEEVESISSLHSVNRFAPIKHAVITARNSQWLPTIRELVQSANEPTVILLGVAHLGGLEGLVPQLTACGLRLAMAGRVWRAGMK